MSGRLQFLEENLNKCVGLDVEVVLVHDHFDEATCDEIRVISDEISPLVNLKLLETETRGVSEARNLGMKSATGAWIVFVDSDDQFTPSLYVEMVLRASMEGKELAVGNFTKFDVDSKVLIPVKSLDKSSRISFIRLGRNPGLWRWAFFNSRIKQYSFKPLDIGEDIDFLLQVNPSDHEIHLFDASIYVYSINFQGQATANPEVLAKLPRALKVLFNTCLKSEPRVGPLNAWILFWIQVSIMFRCGKLLPFKSIALSIYWLLKTSLRSRKRRQT
jgi:glycosyltransferase involved in cell wall biosynthesis